MPALSSTIWRRRTAVGRMPPARAEKLNPRYIAAVDALGRQGELVIVATRWAGASRAWCGHVVREWTDSWPSLPRLSFHPLGKPEQSRTGHLVDLKTPTLIVQGTRGEVGSREEVLSYNLSPLIDILWLEDCDHDLKPCKRTWFFSGRSSRDHRGRNAYLGRAAQTPGRVAT